MVPHLWNVSSAMIVATLHSRFLENGFTETVLRPAGHSVTEVYEKKGGGEI